MPRINKEKKLTVCFCKRCNGLTTTKAQAEAHEKEIKAEEDLRKLEDTVISLTLQDTHPPLLHTTQPADHSPLPQKEQHAQGIHNDLSKYDHSLVTCRSSVNYVLYEWLDDGTINPAVLKSDIRFLSRNEARIFLGDQESWLRNLLVRLSLLPTAGDIANDMYKRSIVEQVQKILDELHMHTQRWDELSSELPHGNTYDTSRHFNHPLKHSHPIIAVSLFLTVVVSVVANAARPTCNFILRMIKLLLSGVLSPDQKLLLDSIPDDVRTARKIFKLDPETTTYATCAVCSSIYPPLGPEKDKYPSRCSFKCFSSDEPCGSRLIKLAVRDGMTVKVPARPYVMQNFTAFAGALYSQPGIEELINRTKQAVSTDSIYDINESIAIRQFVGADGKLFIGSNDEIRTLWSISYDAFNPYHNKAAGKSASVGSLALVCLSLPPSIRYRPENIYLAGLIPGPRQPSLDGLNPFLSPLIDIFHQSYHHGTWYSRTCQHPDGVRGREAIIPAVCDLPGSRKLTGCASHSATRFCSLCHLKKPNINNIDYSSTGWTPVTFDEHLKAAIEWRDAPNKTQRKKIFKKNGVRWSELLRLEYWDPTKYAIIDGMHNLYLGLVKHHFRIIIGTSWDEHLDGKDQVESDEPTDKAFQKGLRVMSSRPTSSVLCRLSIPVLRALCQHFNIFITLTRTGQRLKKQEYVNVLLEYVELVGRGGEDIQPVRHTFIGDIGDIEVNDDKSVPMEEVSEAPLLEHDHLKIIQDHILNTVRPSWQAGLPVNFGSPSHGKLKADQWRTCIEFDLTVSLAKMWGDETDETIIGKKRRMAVESTLLLATAIRYATSHRVTPGRHDKDYKRLIVAYLHSIRELRPDVDLHPIHHNAVHLAEFLPLFGPIHGWWMFPFERLIGNLQKKNINFKFGELEAMLLRAFCAASELRIFLQRPGCPEILRQSSKIVKDCFPDTQSGTLMHDIHVFADDTRIPRGKTVKLDNDIIQAAGFMGSLTTVNQYDRYVLNGHLLSSKHNTARNSLIFYRDLSSSQLIPAVIRQIFQVVGQPEGNIYFAVHTYSQQADVASPFDHHKEFGVSLWKDLIDNDVMIISDNMQIYPAIKRAWSEGVLALKPFIQTQL